MIKKFLNYLSGNKQMAAVSHNPVDDFWFRELRSGKSGQGHKEMGLSAAYAATTLLSSSEASLPLNVVKRDGTTKTVMRDHPLHDILNVRPNPHANAVVFRSSGTQDQLNGDGGFFAEIERDRSGRIKHIWAMDNVTYKVTDSNKLIYEQQTTEGTLQFDQDEVLHVTGKYCPDGIGSEGVVRTARRSMDAAMEAVETGAKSFENGMRPSVAVISNKNLDPTQRANLRADLREMYQGSGNASKPILLDYEMDIKPFSFNANDMQFLETKQHDIDEVARWYGVPPHMIQHLLRATYSNIEHQSIDYVKY